MWNRLLWFALVVLSSHSSLSNPPRCDTEFTKPVVGLSFHSKLLTPAGSARGHFYLFERNYHRVCDTLQSI